MLLHTALEGTKNSGSSLNDQRSFTGERGED